MGEPEIMDLFPDSNGREGRVNAEEISDEGYHYAGRSRLNDYKHSSGTIHRAGGESGNREEKYQERYAERNPAGKKSYINVSDERIVWAGAIFVFFGVFIFLVGYWLGKTTLKDIAFGNKQDLQRIEDTVDQKKMENNYAFNNLPQTLPQDDNNKSGNQTEKDLKAVLPMDNSSNITREDTATPDNLTVPPVKPENRIRAEKNSKIKISSEKPSEKGRNSEKKQRTEKLDKMEKPDRADKTAKNTVSDGKYTIQVSAHTSMEKAREVEDGLRKDGLESYLVEANVNGIIYYRVRVGKFSSKDDALKAVQKIKETPQGRDSMILNLM